MPRSVLIEPVCYQIRRVLPSVADALHQRSARSVMPKARDAGFDHFFIKPLMADVLEVLLKIVSFERQHISTFS